MQLALYGSSCHDNLSLQHLSYCIWVSIACWTLATLLKRDTLKLKILLVLNGMLMSFDVVYLLYVLSLT